MKDKCKGCGFVEELNQNGLCSHCGPWDKKAIMNGTVNLQSYSTQAYNRRKVK
jgi:hypothetical protein